MPVAGCVRLTDDAPCFVCAVLTDAIATRGTAATAPVVARYAAPIPPFIVSRLVMAEWSIDVVFIARPSSNSWKRVNALSPGREIRRNPDARPGHCPVDPVQPQCATQKRGVDLRTQRGGRRAQAAAR